MRPCDPPVHAVARPAALVDTQVRGPRGAGLDTVPEEVPVALAYNGIAHAVMLASPTDLEDFGLGFSLSEAILEHASELYDLEIEDAPHGLVLQMRIAEARFMQLKARRRALAGRTGCGLCGVDSLDQVARPLTTLTAGPAFPATALERALGQLETRQPLHASTGGVHAAAWADRAGNIQAVREDVGRHNALDKLIGALAGQRQDFRAGFILVTSRASFEMVQKAVTAGAGLLAAVSAPTGFAIRLARDSGLCLAGFVRPGRYTLYAHPERVTD
ncbi:formate dehydrogenase accessory sulfurtransferase FdhD [Parasulfuritortus cantonensis]|uniref:Sulfur carrier protein FdhD n=1 Tax=Parasulfuritortus cantonensis TaxID=2528202 RepID=A0A4R1B362_9PROT|nr:formate dehydrogenase accessory sulfurtransferase FdhD [Parasulfuritortus cantonensis]TCJ11910.1 formate dehydrogenase accessory sulfurtransferase FdhD [Parasulfuritortus cantonensis]